MSGSPHAPAHVPGVSLAGALPHRAARPAARQRARRHRDRRAADGSEERRVRRGNGGGAELKDIQKIRLAMRVEGDFWCAYYAGIGTMKGAILLGSIRMSLVTRAEDQERKDAFMRMMQSAMGDCVESLGGEVAGWNDPQIAPEHEKAGRA